MEGRIDGRNCVGTKRLEYTDQKFMNVEVVGILR